MSQHYFPATNEGAELTVMMGWDRPLQGFFCVVSFDEIQDGRELLYCNLDDPELFPDGLSGDPYYFRDRLASLGISVPEAVLVALLNDGAMNRGNLQVFYDAAGRAIRSVG